MEFLLIILIIIFLANTIRVIAKNSRDWKKAQLRAYDTDEYANNTEDNKIKSKKEVNSNSIQEKECTKKEFKGLHHEKTSTSIVNSMVPVTISQKDILPAEKKDNEEENKDSKPVSTINDKVQEMNKQGKAITANVESPSDDGLYVDEGHKHSDADDVYADEDNSDADDLEDDDLNDDDIDDTELEDDDLDETELEDDDLDDEYDDYDEDLDDVYDDTDDEDFDDELDDDDLSTDEENIDFEDEADKSTRLLKKKAKIERLRRRKILRRRKQMEEREKLEANNEVDEEALPDYEGLYLPFDYSYDEEEYGLSEDYDDDELKEIAEDRINMHHGVKRFYSNREGEYIERWYGCYYHASDIIKRSWGYTGLDSSAVPYKVPYSRKWRRSQRR